MSDQLDSEYIPIIAQLPELEGDFFEKPVKALLTESDDYPRFNLGFHHYIHTNRRKMEIVSQFEGKKPVYRVMNRFERTVDNHDSDLDAVSKMYFDVGPKPKILSRAFFKLWELLFYFPLIDPKQKGFVSAHLAEGPGSFIQATMFFRDRYAKSEAKTDKYYAITLHQESKHIPALEKGFVDYYQKEKPKRFFLHQTSRSGGKRDNGDLTRVKTIRNFAGGSMSGQKADLVTADGGFNWENEAVQEQEAASLILGQIIAAIKVQKKGGNFVCKFYEMFTNVSIKMMAALKHFYTDVYITKPLMSRGSNSERYIVCLGFKYGEREKKAETMVGQLEAVLASLEKGDLHLTDLHTGYQPSRKFEAAMGEINNLITHRQLIVINRTVVFIESDNYYGDVYQENREKQIEASEYWANRFLPEPKAVTAQIDTVRNDSKKEIERSRKRMGEMYEKLRLK